MHFELFHHGLLGRHDIVAVDMLHYSGLWGVCFSHHLPTNNHARYAADTTVEGLLRFLGDAVGTGDDAVFRAWSDYTITTHHIDADALIPVWSLLNPEAALERRDLLVRVARCGDFFIYTDDGQRPAELYRRGAPDEAAHRYRARRSRARPQPDAALLRLRCRAGAPCSTTHRARVDHGSR